LFHVCHPAEEVEEAAALTGNLASLSARSHLYLAVIYHRIRFSQNRNFAAQLLLPSQEWLSK
jgi:hypothetical protein